MVDLYNAILDDYRRAALRLIEYQNYIKDVRIVWVELGLTKWYLSFHQPLAAGTPRMLCSCLQKPK